jgi:hypothetical protein
MKLSSLETPSASLPVTRDLTLAYVSSLAVALLVTTASLVGLLYPARLYPTEELRHSFVPSDVVNLLIGLPILLGSMWQSRRGRLLGLLFWPGALLYALYNYIAYVFSLPVNLGFLLSLLVVASSAYTLIALVASIDGRAVQRRVGGAVPERIAGGVLAALGAAYTLRGIVILVGAITSQMPVPDGEVGVLAADLTVSPTWIIGGVLLWRRQPLGYVAGTGLLFQASMLFIGLIAILLLQPLLTGAPFLLVDTLVVFAMGLVCFVPFALFLRGVASNEPRQ